MLFADDLVLCEESILEVEQQLDNWREILEGNGLRTSRNKTEAHEIGSSRVEKMDISHFSPCSM